MLRPIAAVFLLIAAGCASGPAPAPATPSAAPAAEVRAIRARATVIVDGQAAEEAWDAAPETVVPLLGSSGPSSCRVKAAEHRGTLFLLVRWEDATEDREHKPWVRDGDGAWKTGAEREDVLAVAFPMEGTFTANMASPVEALWDVWQWKSARTDPAGHAMDKTHRMTFRDPGGKRHEARLPDGRPLYVARPEDAGLSATEEVPAPASGTRAPRYRARSPEGSASSVAGRGTWSGGTWTVELARALTTGEPDDRDLADLEEIPFALAILDRAEDEAHAASEVLLLRFPEGGNP